jgi:hypothetical protein
MFFALFVFLDRRITFVATILVVSLGMPLVALGSDHGGHGGHEPVEEEVVESATGYRGVELGKFSIRTYRPVTQRREDVDFTLYATVKSEDYKDFDRLYKHRANKVKDQVVVATRLLPIDSYDDPELKTLCRRILLRLRRAMPELKFENLYVSDFNLVVEGI